VCFGIRLFLLLALSQVKFCGEIIGSGKPYADAEKVKAVHDLKIPKTKTELRQNLGFFSYFRQHVCDWYKQWAVNE